MRTLTITEALAELKITDKKIDKKRDFVGNYVIRPADRIDPFKDDGGSTAVIERELQAITDLEMNKINIRKAVAKVNAETMVTVGDKTMSVADWIVWRRDVLPKRTAFLQGMAGAINQQRKQLLAKSATVANVADQPKAQADILVNISEKQLADELEKLETTDGTIDGLLSLKNATVTVDID